MHKLNINLRLLLLCCLPSLVWSQQVITLPINGLDGPNGFVLDKQDRLIIANERGKKVTVLKDDQAIDYEFASDSPDGLAFNSKGELYVSNFHSGTIGKYANGRLTTVYSGLSQPSDIKFDQADNLYVSEYNKDDVVQIAPDGKRRVFVSAVQNPFGLAVSSDGSLFVGSNATGEIFRVKDGSKKLITQLPGAIAYIVYSEKTASIYAVCYTCHKIYKITRLGSVSVVLGQSAKGYRDGDVKEANVEGPNSIALSSKGDLYISENEASRIRKIIGVE